LVKDVEIPKILIFHNKLSTEIALGGNTISKEDYLKQVKLLIEQSKPIKLLFISQTKKMDWGLEGHVITPGIDPNEFENYQGHWPKVLRVGNFLKERDIMMGFSLQEEILKGISSTILGLNPTLPNARFSRSFEDLKKNYSRHRLYLNTTVEDYEDGYNLATLEAMATGMPIVSIANRTSPIIDGVNGYISDNIEYLRERIRMLLMDKGLAKRIGKEARNTVVEKFGIKEFLEKWNEVIEDSVNNGKRLRAENDKGLKVLLSYTSNPQTTAAYIEKAIMNLEKFGYGQRLIFVGGSPRSGTTLIQCILNNHPEICGGPEFDRIPNIIELRNLLHKSITDKRIDVFCTYQQVDEEIGFLIERLLLPYAERKRKTLLSEKTPFNVLYFNELLEVFPKARFIFCVRDPRAVISSMLRVGERYREKGIPAPDFTQDISAAIRTVKICNQKGFEATKKSNRVFTIKYENLVNNPHSVTQDLCNFLNVAWSPSLIQVNEDTETLKCVDGIWGTRKNFGQPPDSQRINRWKKQLTSFQIFLINNSFKNDQNLLNLDYSFKVEGISNEFIKMQNNKPS